MIVGIQVDESHLSTILEYAKMSPASLILCLPKVIPMLLMVSVINLEEVDIAILGGADILDVKNPLEGSLGAQVPHLIRQVRASAPASMKVSAALGDMPNLPGTAALASLGAATCGVDYIKVGLYGSKTEVDAIRLLSAVRQAIEAFPSIEVIAACYADFQRVNTLDPLLLPKIAKKAGISGCLLDTAIKDGHNLFDFLAPEVVQSLVSEAHADNLLFAVAGALHAEHLPLALMTGADVVGVRTAACQDNRRTGQLDPEKIRRLRQQLIKPVSENAS